MGTTLTELEREDVAREIRHWVRIARACNNRCAFCLDSDAQDGTMIPTVEVEREIERGLTLGATRLILSGGEATIHPDFLSLVRFGKGRGYGHVQTITNGRMFAYRRFAARAIEAGLDEVTFSLHGHDAALHDSLTGVEGSFDQTVAGIRNAVGSDRLIVSGDVVINRRNVEHLQDVLETFLNLGVREFDLLMVVPFGRASPGDRGGDLLLSPQHALGPLRRALAWADRPDLHVWTNRLDPRLLEGHERWIQDPHKLHDEVRGRRELMADLVAGRPMRCAGDRCSYCFIHPLCQAMQRAVAAVSQGVPGVLRVDAGADDPPRHRALLGRPREALWVRAADVARAVAVPGIGAARALWLELHDVRGLRHGLRAAGLGAPVRLVSGHGAGLRAAARVAVPEWMVVADRGCIPVLAGIPPRPGTRRFLRSWPSATLREEAERGVPLDRLGELGGADAYLDLPPCRTGAGSVQYDDVLPLAVLDGDGRVDPDAFVEHFVRTGYRVKSLRCGDCRHDRVCRGISVHRARLDGLGALWPVAPDPGA